MLSKSSSFLRVLLPLFLTNEETEVNPGFYQKNTCENFKQNVYLFVGEVASPRTKGGKAEGLSQIAREEATNSTKPYQRVRPQRIALAPGRVQTKFQYHR